MLTVLAFVFAIAVLIVVHELGHYSVARLCGVKVLRFSVGFGKVLFRRVARGPDRTEWTLCAIPLGGYVKMLGESARDPERDPPIPPEDLPRTFDHQPVYKRFAIVAAGPLFNFLLAIALYALLAWVGAQEPLPILGAPPPGSIAAQADLRAKDRVVAVGTDEEAPTPVRAWSDVRMRLYEAGIGGRDAIVQVRGADGAERTVRLRELPSAARSPQVDVIEQVGLRLLGGPVTIAEVLPGSAGERAGLRRGDQIVRFAGQPADQASDLIRWIRAMPEQNASIDILRDGRPMTLPVRLGADADPANPGGPKLGKLGAQLSQHVETELIRDEPVHALGHAMREVWRTSMLSLKVLGKMIVGQASLQNLSGPITVADFAGKAASLGWQSFVAFLALISVSLGVLNLLPVPVLDGGHLLYYCVEFLTGKPVPESWQAVLQKIGIACILLLTSLALYNDLSRLFLAHG
ncbi:RIP metalloprotease RseP [Ralstonia sp. SM1864_UCD524_TZ4]|uniref:Zinc metalloprotease n=3 Tax=Ralstonia solanacearum species complex TaxID=3116862 RepID=A0A0S4VYN0_RALSL|nr:RIP metalloprotease RseP [Ralstonia pseudosolanacearum]CUV22167.1 putative enzyme [Ralstonia solanacearum]CUV33833.1 putative enzyme [Ralstonia solanacearum]CUV39602.1 putative enzyme [Ralstonia solanacearum]CUV63454.1 putative enzyme [Ralstonia solanacearum]